MRVVLYLVGCGCTDVEVPEGCIGELEFLEREWEAGCSFVASCADAEVDVAECTSADGASMYNLRQTLVCYDACIAQNYLDALEEQCSSLATDHPRRRGIVPYQARAEIDGGFVEPRCEYVPGSGGDVPDWYVE